MPRLPAITEREALPEAERWVYDDMVRTRGRVLPGYAPMLHCAELVGRVVNVGSYFRFNASLPAPVLEAIALTVSTELDDAYEQAVHRKGAANAGLTTDFIDDLCDRQPIVDTQTDAQLAAVCAREMLATRSLSEATFALAQRRFSERGVIELVGAIGFYAMLAYMHNAVQVTAS